MADPGTRFLSRGKPGRREQPAHESLRSRATLVEVPLTGLSFKFGRATVTATSFGDMDPSLYADFTKESEVLMNGAENTLRHAGGHYGPAHMASKGPIRDVIKTPGDVPLGSSGIQIIFETDLIIEGIRPGRVVRVRPAAWPELQVPWDECLRDGSHEVRFPTPAIFTKY